VKQVLLVFALVVVTMQSAQATLVGVTATNLVTIDPTNAGNVTIIGPHHLPTGTVPFNSLTYDPVAHKIYGIGLADHGATDDEYIVEYNLQTGQGTVLAQVGTNPVTHFEALEYDHSRGYLIASRTGIPNLIDTSDLVRMNTDGTTVLLASTGLDNDFAVYDSIRDIFYTSDSNGVGTLVRADLGTGSSSTVGNVPHEIDDAAFSSDGDVIYGCSEITNGNCYRLSLNNGGSPLQATSIGQVGGDRILGLAFVPASVPVVTVPALTEWGLLLLILALGWAGCLKVRRGLRTQG